MEQGTIVVDIGGSHITAVMIDRLEHMSFISEPIRLDVDNQGTKEQILNSWSSCIQEVIDHDKEKFSSIVSIAIPGPFDYVNGVALYDENWKFGSLSNLSIRNELQERLPIPCHIHFINDAASFGLGECYFGNLNQTNKSLAITLGTGIGCTFIEDKSIIAGSSKVPRGGEVYHLPFKDSIVNNYFSTRWFVQEAKEKYNIKTIGVKELIAHSNQDIVQAIFDTFSHDLYEFLIPICEKFGAKAISFGGNISKAYSYFGHSLTEKFKQNNIVIYQSLDTEKMIMLGAGISAAIHNPNGAMRILLAPDKFKGSISSSEICQILQSNIQNKPKIIIEKCPLADGGDGSVEIINSYISLNKRTCKTVNPFGRPMTADYHYKDDTAYIEVASAGGFVLVKNGEADIMNSGTYGTGLLMQDAISNGIKHINLFLGGSATNDGGIGIASALGYIFKNIKGEELEPIASSLHQIHTIVEPTSISGLESIQLCCDVNNPPFGPNGSSHIYAKQKGASPDEIEILDLGIQNLCKQIQAFNGKDLSKLQGGGAAGAIAVSLVGLLDSKIIRGMELMSNITNLELKMAGADLVITGEGKLDQQSLFGKVVHGVAQKAKDQNKPVWAIVGKNELNTDELSSLGIQEVFSVIDRADDTADAMTNSSKYIEQIAKDIKLKLID